MSDLDPRDCQIQYKSSKGISRISFAVLLNQEFKNGGER